MDIQEVRTEPFAVRELQESIPGISRFLQSWGCDRLACSYGFACNLPMDELWHPIEVDTVQIESFIQDSVKLGVFTFGQCDLHIEYPQNTLEFRICHESDIHF